MTETVEYSDGTTATGAGPLPKRSPAQQERDHLCSLRRQLRFLEARKPGHAKASKEIAALRWAVHRLERLLDSELEHNTGEPHVDGWPLYSGLPTSG